LENGFKVFELLFYFFETWGFQNKNKIFFIKKKLKKTPIELVKPIPIGCNLELQIN